MEIWEGKFNVYKYGSYLSIGHTFLFCALNKIGFEVMCFDTKDNLLYLNGYYPKENTSNIKKFFFDTYPCVANIIPGKTGLKVYFKTEIEINQNIKYEKNYN